ncbi:MAG: response regulator [Spirochaetales bacterium]|nr:response regulator [Spirochaetales bacterium]
MDKHLDEIIIVDDIPDNLKVLNSILTEEGYNVRVFPKASMAINAAVQSPPDLFLLDILMPEINGYELCIKLQENEKTRGIPVIFLSALNEINEKITAFETGGVDFISKPYQSAEVLARVQTHLKLRRLQINLEDIVEERTHELEKKNKELILANKAKSDFLANINHELRTPLNGVSGMLSVLESMDISDSERYFLDLAVSSADHLSSIMQDILNYSEIDSGRLGIFNQPVQIKKLIQNTVSLLTPRAREKNIDIIIEGRVDSEVFFGDSARIAEILEKLISNAIKFSESGTIKIYYNVNQDLKLSISDHGIGIEPDRLTEIFQPFQQLEDPYTKKYQGVGIGLAIIKKLLDLMEGEISVESELETGSVFTIIIPNNPSDAKLEKSSIDVDLNVNRSDNPKLKILIAEDEGINRMFLKNLLNKAGHNVLEARNGEEALTKTIAEIPDFIFMDIGMPVMNGMEAAKRIRKTDGFSTIPIIALTAHTHKEDIEKFLNSGLDEVLKKPFKEIEIYSIIKKYI